LYAGYLELVQTVGLIKQVVDSLTHVVIEDLDLKGPFIVSIAALIRENNWLTGELGFNIVSEAKGVKVARH